MNALTPFLVILVGMAAVMTLAWLTQRAVRNGGWVDVFWTFGTGAACVTAALWPELAANVNRQFLVASLSAVWALRLGGYIAHRVATGSEDTRYAGLREEWGDRFQANMFWLVIVQAPAAAVLSLSVFAAAHGGATEIGWRDLLGAAVLLIAIAGEGLADEQMRRFKRLGHHGAIMDTGLWGWSRHPNYFFEWFGWLAYPLIAIDLAGEYWPGFLALGAPLLMYWVVVHGTGIPPLEAHMLRSRGDAFRRYQSRTRAFFPFPKTGGNAS